MRLPNLTFFLVKIFLFLFILSGNLFSQSTVKILGRVADKTTNQPLYSANVTVEGTGFGASTDPQGYFQIENLLEGIYTVSASHIGYGSQKYIDIRVLRDQPVQLNFSLESRAIPLQEVAVAAERFEQQAGSGIWIITSESISRTNAQNVGELIDLAPGVEVRDAGGSGGSKKISIRGSQTNQVLVMLDGVPLNDELGGDVDLANIPINMIEKIEIYKGGSSHRFGSGAISGAVNIITKKSFANNLQLNSGFGSFGSYRVEPNWSGSYKNFGYYFSYNYIENQGNFPYSYTESDGQTIQENRMNADILSRNLFGKLSYLTDHHQFLIQAQRLESFRGIPGKIDGWTPYARNNNFQDIFGAEYLFNKMDFRAELNFRYATNETENSNLYPDDVDRRYKRYPRYHYQYDVTNYIVNSNIDFVPTSWFHFNAGYTFRNLNFRNENLMPSLPPPINQAEDASHGFFIHNEFNTQLPWQHAQIAFTPAIRYDEMNLNSGDQKRFEHQWSPAAGLLFSIGKIYKGYFKSIFSKAFRVPTFADLFYQDVRIEGKPDLLPEKSENVEFGWGWQISKWGVFSGEITTFQNNIQDLIVWRLGSFEVFRPFNTDAEISGQEYLLSFQSPHQLIDLELSYTQLEPLNKTENQTTYDKIIPYRPLDSFKGSLTINFENIYFNLGYRNVGERFITEANTKSLSNYQVLDSNFAWTTKIGKIEAIWKFSAYNLTNEKYEIVRDMPLPPREWRVGLNLKL
ncbi:TonB-dependent receptor [candidate division KSB1 bacterium]|nr:TonB-dependent receptor [candidate division KSB1 bacterium]